MTLTPEIERAIAEAERRAAQNAVDRIEEVLRLESREDRDNLQDDLRWLRRKRSREEERGKHFVTTTITSIIAGLLGALISWSTGLFNLRGH